MPKEKTIWISALNIKTQPHTPDKYIDLFNDAFSLKQIIKLRADDHGMIGWKRFIDPDSPLEGITGEIYKFLQLDPNRPWLNLQEGKEAEPQELEDIQIPEFMKPNMSSFRFAFFPKGHRLFFETYSDRNRIGPSLVLTLFEKIFSHPSIRDKYGEVDVFLEPSREKLEEILSIFDLRRLEMRITRPNPDDSFEFEQSVFKRMELESADIYEYNVKGKGINPSEDTRNLARVAASNGYVKGVGQGQDGKRVDESTQKHPLRDHIEYNSDLESSAEVFLCKAKQMLAGLHKWIRGEPIA